jgi:hypothetical protein
MMARRQSFAPFRATTLKNEAATFGAHALTETMSFGATTIIGLIGTLHCDSP